MGRLHLNNQYLNPAWTVEKAGEELNLGLQFLNTIPNNIVTFFGSHRVSRENKYYQDCRELAFKLGKKGYAILSGGGPGIMHAANAGAMEAGAQSVGMIAELLTNERVTDPIFTKILSFRFLFARRFLMSIKSDALIFYPGGYGTLNELFEYAVLMQTKIVDTVPIICINKPYWEGLFGWLANNPLKEDFFINHAKDLDLIHFVDDHEEIIRIIENTI